MTTEVYIKWQFFIQKSCHVWRRYLLSCLAGKYFRSSTRRRVIGRLQWNQLIEMQQRWSPTKDYIGLVNALTFSRTVRKLLAGMAKTEIILMIYQLLQVLGQNILSCYVSFRGEFVMRTCHWNHPSAIQDILNWLLQAISWAARKQLNFFFGLGGTIDLVCQILQQLQCVQLI